MNQTIQEQEVARRYLLEIDFELIQTEGLASGSSFPVGTTKNSFVITDAAGNSSTCSFEVLVDASVNINELQTLPEVEIYPNPAKETFLINQKSEFLIEQCRIINLRGMIVKNIPIYNFRIPDQIDISRLHSGIYFIQMQTDQGLIIRRVIVL